MKWLIILIIFVVGVLFADQLELIGGGALTQLLTSKPYYTGLDVQTHMKKFPYYYYLPPYPSYFYPPYLRYTPWNRPEIYM